MEPDIDNKIRPVSWYLHRPSDRTKADGPYPWSWNQIVFSYNYAGHILSFFEKVFNHIFDYDRSSQQYLPRLIPHDDGSEEITLVEIGLTNGHGKTIPGKLRGRPLTPEEALPNMEKRVYYDKHYYYILDDPTHLSYITPKLLLQIRNTEDMMETFKLIEGECDYLYYIISRHNKSLNEELADLKTVWVKKGYVCIPVEDEDIDYAKLCSQEGRILKIEDSAPWTCDYCGEIFKAMIRVAYFSLVDGSKRLVIGVTCPHCGKFWGKELFSRKCRYCGKKFVVLSHESGRYSDFCSDECKQRYRRFAERFENNFSGNAPHDECLERINKLIDSGIFPKSIEERLMVSRCLYCGKILPPNKRAGSNYCNETCKKAFMYRFRKEQTVNPDITPKDLSKILHKEHTENELFWRRTKRLKWWIAGGAPLQGEYIDEWRNKQGKDFKRTVDKIKRRIEEEKHDPVVRDNNLKRLRSLLEKGKLDIYPATEEFYLKGYFGNEFESLVRRISKEIVEGKNNCSASRNTSQSTTILRDRDGEIEREDQG